MTRSALEFDRVSKSFFGVAALSDVTLSIPEGCLLGLIGENGAGKSTLMNALAGVITPDQGTMRLFGVPFHPTCPADATRAGIAFIHQELNLFSNLSVVDNLYIDGFPRLCRLPIIDKRKAYRQAAELLTAVDLCLSPATPIELLTPGERQLVEIAKALGRNARIIIFDEPTTSLTAAERSKLFQVIDNLRREGRTIIYISHSLDDVLRLADTIAVLRDGKLVSTGPGDQYSANRMVADMVGREIAQMYPARASAPGPESVLDVKSLTQPGMIKDISFTLHEGEVLGVFGLMGSGRSELARIVYGLDPFKSGSIRVRGTDAGAPSPIRSIRNGVAFVTENRRQEGLLMEAPVSENIDLSSLRRYARYGSARIIDRRAALKAARQMAESLQIKSGSIDRHRAKHLSGGNQQKVVIAKWLLTDPGILILDEPTRGIDVGAKYELYSIINDLASRGTAILYISSELEELTGMCDRILVMSNGEIQAQFRHSEFDQESVLQAAFRGRTTANQTEANGEN